MGGVITQLWWFLTQPRGWRNVRRTVPDPLLGTLVYVGQRTRPDGPVNGIWQVTYPKAGVTQPLSVSFPTGDKDPAAEDVATLKGVLDDLDGVFARCRAEVSAQYEQTVEAPMPPEWRDAFRLDSIQLADPEDPDSELDVSYWCEAALHWFTVSFHENTVTYVSMDG